ncbi:hypothetical protein GGR95_000231 [Sulfitobacter undariae]|uniref:Uncharacterized protein n=1 Tax=Sulfitobacter undariae TaxID=1563671 RepID=A0A7W6GZ28_9RHOB|nr:hypothetical protein [Sulfitobacter undariae]
MQKSYRLREPFRPMLSLLYNEAKARGWIGSLVTASLPCVFCFARHRAEDHILGKEHTMRSIIYIVGLVVIVLAIVRFAF